MNNQPRQYGTRRGISLLEILISIGIVTIGLVGVASMIPAAHFKAAQGVRRDRVSAMGQRALDDFLIRGYADPGATGLAGDPKWVTYINGVRNFGMYGGIGTDGRLIRGSYCFDPYSIAWRLNNPRQNNDPITYPDQFDPCPRFPPYPGNFTEHLNFGIPRVCPNTRLINPPTFPWNVNDSIYNEEAILASWESIFTLKDDMAFQMPEKTNDPRTQEYYSSTNMLRAKRLNNGEYSWMATLTPEGEFGTVWNPATQQYTPQIVSRAAHRYNLSILVFNRRVFDRLKPNQEIFGLIPDNPNTPQINESIALPTNLTTFDIQVDPPVEFQNPDLGATFADVGSGKWVGLMQQLGGVTIIKWFKVLSAIDQSNGAGTRFNMTLTGQAWNMPFPPNPNNIYERDPRINRSQIFVIYLNQVVGVQERSIELYAN